MSLTSESLSQLSSLSVSVPLCLSLSSLGHIYSYFLSSEGSKMCTACSVGMYANETGMTTCKKCEPGQIREIN